MQKIVDGTVRVHLRNYILGKFFVPRFYSRHISPWHNYSGKFIVWRFYNSQNNRTPLWYAPMLKVNIHAWLKYLNHLVISIYMYINLVIFELWSYTGRITPIIFRHEGKFSPNYIKLNYNDMGSFENTM